MNSYYSFTFFTREQISFLTFTLAEDEMTWICIERYCNWKIVCSTFTIHSLPSSVENAGNFRREAKFRHKSILREVPKARPF